MTLVAWGETHIDSSIAGIAQASVPIFVAILGLRLPSSRSPSRRPGRRARGGVRRCRAHHGRPSQAAVPGQSPGRSRSSSRRLSYAAGGILRAASASTDTARACARHRIDDRRGDRVAAVRRRRAPDAGPRHDRARRPARARLVPTFLGQLLLFRILRLFGSRRLSLVTFLMPGFAVVYGAALLDEPISAVAIAGLALILVGVDPRVGPAPLRRPRQESPA